MLGALAVLTLILGNVVAIAQTNIKRLLAYSAISNIGFIFWGSSPEPRPATRATLFYTLVYILATLGTLA